VFNSLTVVIPVYKGALTITNVCETLIDTCSKSVDFEIVLVNDYSPDNSHDVCLQLYKEYPQIIKYVRLAKNVGEHNAVMAGLSVADKDYIVIMDDDCQNTTEDVIRLLDYATKENYDVVYTYYAEKKHSWFRNLGSRFNDIVATVMLRKPKNLYLSSFKLINRFVVNEIIKYKGPFPYIDGLILQITSNIGRIEAEHKERRVGKSSYTLIKLVSLWSNMFTNFSILPLRVSVLCGFIFTLIGFSLGLYSIYEKIVLGISIRGWASLIITIITFSGIQLFMLGMIGEYLGRLFLSYNGAPQYTIREVYRKQPTKRTAKAN